MDQKTFLAIVLSLGIFVMYNKMFVEPKINELKDKNSQVYTNKEDIEIVSSQNVVPKEKISKAIKNFADEKQYYLKNEELTLEFSNIGANLKKISLIKHNHSLPVVSFAGLPEYQDNIFGVKQLDNKHIQFLFENNSLKITKTYQLNDSFEIECNTEIYNKLDQNQDLALKISPFTIDMSSVDKKVSATDKPYLEYSILTDKKMLRKGHADSFSEKNNSESTESLKWVGYRDRFFAAISKNDFSVNKFKISFENNSILSIEYPLINNLNPRSTVNYKNYIYYGPQQLDPMKKYNREYDRILAFSNFGVIDFFAFAIYKSVHFVQKIVKNWGISIVLISIFLFTLTFPLTQMSMKSMKKFQAIQPEINALKAKYKANPEKMNAEMAALIKKSGANPFGGCLPMLLQMPIFFAVFQVFWRTYSFKGQDFLWIKDLALPDHLFKFPFDMPGVGGYFNLLPIIYAIAIFFQQKVSSAGAVFTNPEDAMRQKMMVTMMPFILVIAFYHFSSSITLYFTVFYSLQAFVQWKLAKSK